MSQAGYGPDANTRGKTVLKYWFKQLVVSLLNFRLKALTFRLIFRCSGHFILMTYFIIAWAQLGGVRAPPLFLIRLEFESCTQAFVARGLGHLAVPNNENSSKFLLRNDIDFVKRFCFKKYFKILNLSQKSLDLLQNLLTIKQLITTFSTLTPRSKREDWGIRWLAGWCILRIQTANQMIFLGSMQV